jgi:MFS family permease
MGVSAGAGYLGVAGAAFLAGLVAWRAGLRPEPFLVGLGCALAGLAIAVVLLRDTSAHVEHEASSAAPGPLDRPRLRETVAVVSVRDRTMSSCVQAGFFNQFNDAVAWGIFPLVFASRGLTLAQIATLAAIYPAVWGVGQFATGALSDAFDRRRVIAWGMWIQALALSLVVPSGGLATAGVAVVTLGAGTAMVYPTLLAAVGDGAGPRWRASALGVYRLWRDAGLVAGAVVGGLFADVLGLPAAIAVVAALTAASGVLVALRMPAAGRPRPRRERADARR